MYENFGFNKNIENPENIIRIIDSASNIFIVKFDAKNSKNNILGYFESSVNSLIQAMIKSISIPTLGFNDESYKRGGYSYHEAGEIQIGDCNITSYNDLNSFVYSFWYKWYSTIIKGKINSTLIKDNYRLFPEEYKLNITILKLFRESKNYKTINDKMQEIVLDGCYPYNVSFSDLNWNNNEIPEFTINLKVDKISFNNFTTELSKLSRFTYYNEQDINSITNQINLSKYKNNIKGTIDEYFTEMPHIKKIKQKYDEFQGALISKLEETKKSVISNILSQAKAEIYNRLPTILQNFNFFDQKVLIDQILSKVETWVKGKILDVSDSLKSNNNSSNPKLNWNISKTNKIDEKTLMEEILNDWNTNVFINISEEKSLENLKNWNPKTKLNLNQEINKVEFNPTKTSSDSTPDINFKPLIAPINEHKLNFNPTNLSYEELIIKSEKVKKIILDGINK